MSTNAFFSPSMNSKQHVQHIHRKKNNGQQSQWDLNKLSITNYYTTYCTTSQIAKMSLWRYSWKEAVNILCKFWVKFNQQIIIKFCATHNTIHASLFFFLWSLLCVKKKTKMGGELSPGFHTLTLFCLTAKCTYLHKLFYVKWMW